MLLTYHEISSAPAEYVYSTTSAELSEHLRVIQTHQARRGEQPITFDDGHISQYTHGVPVLEQHGVKAIFFVTAGWTGRRPNYMQWDQLRELVSLGHEVQSHGWSHAMLTRCAPEKLIEELRRSRQSIEEKMGVHVGAISMPGGRWNKDVLSQCEEAGYTRIYTSDPYDNPRSLGKVTVVGRYMIRRRMSGADVLNILRSRDAIFSSEKARFRLKRSARTLLGDRVYHRLWRWAGHSEDRGQDYNDASEGLP